MAVASGQMCVTVMLMAMETVVAEPTATAEEPLVNKPYMIFIDMQLFKKFLPFYE